MELVTRKEIRGKHRGVRLEAVVETANLEAAVAESRRGKNRNKGVVIYDRTPRENLERLRQALATMSYRTSEGHECLRRCPCGKVRRLHKLPYYPDHVTHHALMRVLMPHLVRALYHESGASVKGRGIHYAARRTGRWIDEHKGAGRLYYCKLDFVKFYESVDQQRIYDALCRMFRNKGVRYLLREAVTATERGLGIGLYPIQTLTNFYMSRLCREVCGRFGVRVEVYCDDVVILGEAKKEVWKAVNFVRDYAEREMNQRLHGGYSVQVIDGSHALDFVGYRFYFGHTLVRKRIKERFRRKMRRLRDPMVRYRTATAYKGWLMRCDGFNLWRRVTGMKSFKELSVPRFERRDANGKRILDGTRVGMGQLANREITFMDAEFGVHSKLSGGDTATVVQVEEHGLHYKFFTNNGSITETLRWCAEHGEFPFLGTLRQKAGTNKPDYEIV